MFLEEPPRDDAVEAAYAGDLADDGYVSNGTRLWAWRPGLYEAFGAFRQGVMDASTLTDRDWAVMVTSTASELRDSYCSLAWGAKLAKLSDAETAAGVLAGEAPAGLSEREAALAAWTRKVVRDPNGTTAADVQRLRDVGYDEREIFEATVFVGLRLAFSTVNDALGAQPDRQLADAAPEPVRTAVDYGRAPAAEPSAS